MKKEYKTVSFDVKEVNEDDDYFKFEGYASTFGNVDLGGDLIQKGAFTKSITENQSLPILSQHDMDNKIGDSIEMYEDDNGLFIKAILPKSDTFVSGRVVPQMKSSMKAGRQPEMSIGYYVKDFEYIKDIRVLKEIGLFEVSIVTKAMNPNAKVSALFKSCKSLGDIEGLLKDHGLSNNESKALIAKVKEFSSCQREADQQDNNNQREADVKNTNEVTINKIISDLSSFTKSLKNIN